MSKKVTVFRVFTDGSADNKDKKIGGIGAYFPEYKHFNISKGLRGDCTNQRMELIACIEAIKIIIKSTILKSIIWRLEVITDSLYLKKIVETYAPVWIQNGWYKLSGENIKNLDLVKEIYTLYSLYNIKIIHTNSHTSEPQKGTNEWNIWYGNYKADKLARHGRQSLMNKA